MSIVKQNQPKSKHQTKPPRAQRHLARWKTTVDTLIKLLPLLTGLLTALMPLIILLGTHHHWL